MARAKPPKSNSIEVRPITAEDWPHIEKLFGPNGACGGCWCMWWRVPRGGKLWEQNKGARNRRAFKKLVTEGRVHGCLAFHGVEPVGWCCVGPRSDFPRLDRTKALQVEWDENTWSVVCFFIRAGWRRQGVAQALLNGAVQVARACGACEVQGYPVQPKRPEGVPAAFAWTGVPRLFETCQFEDTSPPDTTRPIYRLNIRSPKNR